MRTHPPAHRALDVVVPFTVYGAIGRRPSGVFVDSAMTATVDGTGAQPLWDLVFEAVPAAAGDQIQDRPGGIVLVSRDGESRPVQLTPPVPRSLTEAFTHAERILAADRAQVERLVAEGLLAVAPIRRIRAAAPPPARTLFTKDHPLVSAAPAA
jgi:hypothetical protein